MEAAAHSEKHESTAVPIEQGTEFAACFVDAGARFAHRRQCGRLLRIAFSRMQTIRRPMETGPDSVPSAASPPWPLPCRRIASRDSADPCRYSVMPEHGRGTGWYR